MNALHQRAVDLWVHFKRKDPAANPASGIIFAITDSVAPSGFPQPSNTVELCAALNHMHGLPPMTAEERMEIQVYGAVALARADRGLSQIQLALAIPWANRLAYALGLLALVLSGFSWWVLVFLVGTWWAYGATRMCAQKQAQGEGPAWEMPACIGLHVICLIGLYCVSVVRIL